MYDVHTTPHCLWYGADMLPAGAFTVLPYFGYVQVPLACCSAVQPQPLSLTLTSVCMQTATMVPVPSSLNQATSYAAQHANNVNANDFYLVFIGASWIPLVCLNGLLLPHRHMHCIPEPGSACRLQ